jgi:hypothetical protein
MKWIKYDPNNVPQDEVLAKNNSSVMVGYLDSCDTCYTGWKDDEYYMTLLNITHYIPVAQLINLPADPF